jgi:hypothetical protein
MAFIRAKENVIADLCTLYDELKKMEYQRGPGIIHGMGVFPKSRRLLLGVICHLEDKSGGSTQASSILRHTFEDTVQSIASLTNNISHLGHDALFHLCENIFDIAAFGPQIANSIFDIKNGSSSIQAQCLQVIHHANNLGFTSSEDHISSPETIVQWNRLRAAIFTLFRKSGSFDLPTVGTEMLISWIQLECHAAMTQCAQGPTSVSRIFNEDIISEETIPPGLFIQVLSETLEQACFAQVSLTNLRNALYVLAKSQEAVLQTISSQCPSPIQKGSFHDPRPVIAEVWFICMNKLSSALLKQRKLGVVGVSQDATRTVHQILLETFVVAICLLFCCSLEKTQEKRLNDAGMSLDGPQGLVMMEFFELFFSLGSEMLEAAANKLVTVVPVDNSQNPDAVGMAIIGAALFRIAQGNPMPPWALESVPLIYSSLYKALGKSTGTFIWVLEMSMSVRLLENHQFGNISGGTLLSGRYFEKMSDGAKTNFLDQARALSEEDTTASWRRLKTMIKQACGGKKKDTDFNQKPALTRWDTLDRI